MGNPLNPFKKWGDAFKQSIAEKKKQSGAVGDEKNQKPVVPAYQGQGQQPQGKANVPQYQGKGPLSQGYFPWNPKNPPQPQEKKFVYTPQSQAEGAYQRFKQYENKAAANPVVTKSGLTLGQVDQTINGQKPSWFYPGRGANVPQLWDKSQHFSPENYAPLTPGAAPATIDSFKSYFGDKPFSFLNDRMAAEENAQERQRLADAYKDPYGKIENIRLNRGAPTTMMVPAYEGQPAGGGGDGGYPGGGGYGGYGGGGYGGGGGYDQKLPPWYYGLSTWRI
jgi:hypothetical protein